MAPYTYSGSFTSPDSDADPTAAGIPTVASYNPYNGLNGTTTVLASNPASQVASSIVSFQNENAITTLPSVNVSFNTTSTMAMFIVGGTAGFNNAFGVAVSPTSVDDPTALSNRWILVPNSKSAVPNASTQPTLDATTVTGGYTIPLPLNTEPVFGSTPTNDGHGTAIADHTQQIYSGVGSATYIYPFLLPNAWKYDPTAPSESRWYVDTATEPWWTVLANPAPDTNVSHVVFNSNTSHGIQSVNFSGTHSAFPSLGRTYVIGFEDFVINTAETLDPPELNQDFNDFVFAPVSFT